MEINARGLFKPSKKNSHFRSMKNIINDTFIFIATCLMMGLLSLSPIANAQTTPESLFGDTPSFLKVDEAFGFDYVQKDGQLIVKWDIADGYYLYKKQFKTASKGAVIGKASYPESEQIEDEFFGLSDVFYEDMEISYPIIKAKKDGSANLNGQCTQRMKRGGAWDSPAQHLKTTLRLAADKTKKFANTGIRLARDL